MEKLKAKSMKKSKKFCSLMVFSIGAMVLVSSSVMSIEPLNILTDRNAIQKDVEPRLMRPIEGIESCNLAVPLNAVKIIPTLLPTTCLGTDIPISSSPDDDTHPAMAMDEDGNLIILYETTVDFFDHDLIATASTDGGETWPDELRGGWLLEGFQTMPDLDYWGPRGDHHVYGTYADLTEPGTSYLVDIPDITNHEDWVIWGLVDWGSAYDFYDFHDTSFAGYSGFIPEFWGAIFFISSTTYEDDEMENGPTWVFTLDPYMEGYLGIHWSPTRWETACPACRDCSHAKIDIDQSNGKAYAVFETLNETTGTQDIWMEWHPNADQLYWEVGPYWNYSAVIEGSPNYRNPDVAAANENVYIVMQTDENGNEDIICIYSNDNGTTWDISTVVESDADEQYPVIATTDHTVTCLYVQEGNLYSTVSEDGGVTWDSPHQINDEEGTVVEEYRGADVEKSFGTWTDNRNDNNDIYFDTLEGIPIIEIGDISGGFGLSATISNTGTVDATDVQWSITLEGGLILLGGETTDTIDRLAASDSVTVSTDVLFGLGKPTITVTADGTEETTSATLFLFFILGLT